MPIVGQSRKWTIGAVALGLLVVGGASLGADDYLTRLVSNLGVTAFEVQNDGDIVIQDVTYTPPQADGSSGSILCTDGVGGLAWCASSGATIFDMSFLNDQFVNEQGDTMSGAFVFLNQGVAIEIVGTLSGATLHAQDELTSSGSLTVEGATVLFGYADIFNTLEIHGTASGSSVHAENDLTSSGSLTVEGATVLNGATTFNGLITSIEALSLSGASVHAQDILTSSGVLVVEGNATVNDLATLSGATVTNDLNVGALLGVTGAATLSSTLRVTGQADFEGTASGSHIHAEDTLTSSGTLTVEGNTVMEGTLTVQSALSGASTLTLSPMGAQANSVACWKADGVLGYWPVSATGTLVGTTCQ